MTAVAGATGAVAPANGVAGAKVVERCRSIRVGDATRWDEWHHPDGTVLRTFVIITTSPNELMRTIHDRMPVILTPDQVSAWLADADEAVFKPFPAAQMEAYPISTLVNSPKNNSADMFRIRLQLG